MAATSFEDRLARLAVDGPRTAQPAGAHIAPKSTAKPAHRAKKPAGRDENPDMKRLGIYFLGGFFGLALSVVLNIGMIAGSPWGPDSDISKLVMLPTMALSVVLIIGLVPAALFYRRAGKSFAFLVSACALLFVGFFV